MAHPLADRPSPLAALVSLLRASGSSLWTPAPSLWAPASSLWVSSSSLRVSTSSLWAALSITALAVVVQAAAPAAYAQPLAERSATVDTRQGVVGVEIGKLQEHTLPLCPGGNIHYTVRIENIGTVAGSAEIVDPIPAGTTYVPGSAGGGASFDGANGRIVWEGLLAPGESHDIGFSVTVDPGVPNGTDVLNRATGRVIAGETVAEQDVEVGTEVACPADPAPLELEVDKTAHYAEPLQVPGGNIFFQIRLTNRSARDAPLTARVDDPIPAGTTFEGSLTGGAVYDALAERITWSGALAPGKTKTIGFSVTVDPSVVRGDVLTNVATVELSDLERGDAIEERATVMVPIPEEAIGLIKSSFPDDPLCPGSTIDYLILLVNPTESGQALEGAIEDAIPARTTFVPGSLFGDATYDSADQRIEWQGTLQPGESKLIGFSVQVDPGVALGTVISNSAEATLTDPETGESLEARDATTDPVDCDGGGLQIDLTKTSNPDMPLCPGSEIDYEIVLTNPRTNGSPLLGSIFDLIPADTTYVDGSLSSQGGAGLAFILFGRQIYWFGALDAGDSVTLRFTVKVDDNVQNGTSIQNRADAVLFDPAAEDSAVVWRGTEDVVDCDDGGTCPMDVTGFVEDAVGNGQGSRYPVSSSRVWLLDVGNNPLPIAPLSDQVYEPLREGHTSPTFETDLRDEEFPLPGRARYDFDFTTLRVSRCPPRTVVVSALWDADDRFAVAPRNHVGGRYVPAYLARCISDEPVELMPAGPCYEWRLRRGEYVPWDPVADEPAEVSFTYGASPTNRESTEVIRHPATSDPPLSEAWDLGPGLPPDAFFRDAAHMYFFSYKAMETLTGLAAGVSAALGDLAAEGEEPKTVPLAPALITPHDRDCPSGCTWPVPQLTDDPLAPLPGRLPLSFGGLVADGPTVSAGTLVAFGPDHSGALSFVAGFPDPGDKPDNREWHELGHHWMLQLYGGDWPGAHRNDSPDCRDAPPSLPPVPAGHGSGNHCGYANRTTTDSYIEGFAELTSMLIAESYGDERPFLYHLRGNDQNLEVDRQVWGPYRAAGSGDEVSALDLLDSRDEDFAVAGILWDLLDGGNPEPRAHGTASDAIGTADRSDHAAADLFAHLRDRRPGDLSDLHATLSNAFPGDTDGDGFSDVDEIFIAHGAFGDAERDLRHDDGEILGDTGSSALPVRPVRPSREPVPNGYFDIGFVADGFPFSPFGFSLELEYRFEAPYEHYDWDRTVRSRPRLYLHMPPPIYPCRVTITARGKGGFADRRSDPFTITCAEYWNAIGSGAPSLGAHTFVLEEEETPAVPPGPWLSSPELPGFEAKVRITPRGGEPTDGAAEPACIVETLCVSGALPGRPEIFVKVIGPRPNGKLWTQIARFTPSEVEVWLRQVATGLTRYYRLESIGPTSDDVSGLQDREAFDPVGGGSVVRRAALLPGAAVERLPAAAMAGAVLTPRGEGDPAPPPGIEWLTTPELPGFRVKARITPAGSTPDEGSLGGQRVERCIPETLCVAGALAGRPEVFAKIIGPRPNGFLWVQGARFTPSAVELWVERTAAGTVRYYRLAPVPGSVDDVSGLQDREAFMP